MAKKIVIDPLTRIEGHGKITIHVDEDGRVNNAFFHVGQVRGFEKLCEGRPFYEMPSLMARICGICPVSHLMASAKACDALMGVRIPEPGANLRRIMHLAQIIQSHALSFFHLSSPDLLLGMDADPTTRNIFGLMSANPNVARDGIRLRQFGQEIIESLGGKRIHPAWVVPGGVNAPLKVEQRDRILSLIPEGIDIILRTLAWFKRGLEDYREEIRVFGNFPTMFMGMVSATAGLGFYGDGWMRIVDSTGNIVADHVDPCNYQEFLGEAVEPWTYLKFPYYKPLGYPNGIYRVGPLARLNIVNQCGTPLADQEYAEFRTLERGAVLSSFHYHYARLIEILFCWEKMEQLLHSEDILSKHVRAFAAPNNFEGVGVAEAPRGTLIHHYKIDDQGRIIWANLIIATGHNNLAMNRAVLQVARRFVDGNKLEEGMLNRVEAVIRAYDPCLSCSTHAIGQMPLTIELVGPQGEVLDKLQR
ncbi:MAG TPA: Ni/Fe hydrogenase subunit alpha [Acidobacteriota bacterium]|nr:Ni/Fe hydrogenase subunit alpha [Acidobacteriota bacterium]